MKRLYAWESKRTSDYEREIFDQFQTHSIISKQDASYMPFPDRIHIVPNGIDLSYFDKKREGPPNFDLGFIGNMGYLPNIEAALFLCTQIVPLLEKELGRAVKVLIAGARPDHRILALRSATIDVTGWVDDIRDMYLNCRVLCAPLFNGTGQQNKILEAMALGIPCVTTAEVNRAIGATNQEHLMISDTPQEFVRVLSNLIRDEAMASKLGENGKYFVNDLYDWNPSIKKLNAIFAKTIQAEVEL